MVRTMALQAAFVAGLALTSSGCAHVVSGSATSAAGDAGSGNAGQTGAAACTHVDAPLQDVPAHSAGEPQVRVPQLPGWNRLTKMDSEVIRFTVVNQALATNDFAPNMVVTLEPTPPLDPPAVFDGQAKNLRDILGATDLTSTPATVCGLPAAKLTLNLPPMGAAVTTRPAQALVVVAHVGSSQFLVTATMQTTDPDNPTYQHDAQTMMDGLQVLVPGS